MCHVITLSEAPHVRVVAFKNGQLVRFATLILEVSFYWWLIHISKHACLEIFTATRFNKIFSG
jgi:hypothetical protein